MDPQQGAKSVINCGSSERTALLRDVNFESFAGPDEVFFTVNDESDGFTVGRVSPAIPEADDTAEGDLRLSANLPFTASCFERHSCDTTLGLQAQCDTKQYSRTFATPWCCDCQCSSYSEHAALLSLYGVLCGDPYGLLAMSTPNGTVNGGQNHNTAPTLLSNAAHFGDMNHVWSLVEELSGLLQSNRAQWNELEGQLVSRSQVD